MVCFGLFSSIFISPPVQVLISKVQFPPDEEWAQWDLGECGPWTDRVILVERKRKDLFLFFLAGPFFCFRFFLTTSRRL